MTSEWLQQIDAIEERARCVNLALGQLCVAAGVPPSNLCRWKQGGSPSLRVFLRDLSKLESELRSMEFKMAMKLIERINPAAAPRIAELLRTPNAGCSGASSSSGPDRERDGWKDSAETRVAEWHGPDRAA